MTKVLKMLAFHTNSTGLTTCGGKMDFGEVKNNQCQVTWILNY